jgi:hypothetical protein
MRRRVNRGNNGASNLNSNNSWNTNTNNGLRPVLVSLAIRKIKVLRDKAWFLQERLILSAISCKHINNGIMLSTKGTP